MEPVHAKQSVEQLVQRLTTIGDRQGWSRLDNAQQWSHWEATVAEGRLLTELYPTAIQRLAQRCIQHAIDGSTILSTMLSWLPIDRWPALVAEAVAILQHGPRNAAAITVVEVASLQCLAAVHPHLEAILRLPDYANYLYANVPFREAPWENVRFLSDALVVGDATTQQRAAYALLTTQQPHALAFVARYTPQYLDYLYNLGFADTTADARLLYGRPPHHLIFPAEYLARMPRYASTFRDWGYTHPTWTSPAPLLAQYRFGGEKNNMCERCGAILAHILTLDPLPEWLGITSRTRLSLAACLSCLDEGYATEEDIPSYTHDMVGNVQNPLTSQIEYITGVLAPLMETTVALADLGARWRWQDWTDGENINRLGGYGSWVQDAEYPPCPGCGKPMTFLLQLNVEDQLPTTDGTQLHLLDGLCYAYWCDRCAISTYRLQGT